MGSPLHKLFICKTEIIIHCTSWIYCDGRMYMWKVHRKDPGQIQHLFMLAVLTIIINFVFT